MKMKRILIGKTNDAIQKKTIFPWSNWLFLPFYVPLLRIALLGIANNASMSQSRKSLRDSLHVKAHCSISQSYWDRKGLMLQPPSC